MVRQRARDKTIPERSQLKSLANEIAGLSAAPGAELDELVDQLVTRASGLSKTPNRGQEQRDRDSETRSTAQTSFASRCRQGDVYETVQQSSRCGIMVGGHPG
ncbi:hypothetical protein GCM10027344_01730 [Spelaeicoccus albus]